MSSVGQNIQIIQDRLAGAARAGGFSPPPQIIAVSKTQSADNIRAALEAGHRIFGENRVQEAQAHWSGLRDAYPDLQLHLIGPLQTNKVRDAVKLFDVVHTLDREKLALALRDEMKKQGRVLPCFVQVNLGAEPQKAGVSQMALKDFVSFCREDCRLIVTGLMCIPPVNDPSAPYFIELKNLARGLGLRHLSMGMSGDYETAAAHGATHVRIGSAIFGPRL